MAWKCEALPPRKDGNVEPAAVATHRTDGRFQVMRMSELGPADTKVEKGDRHLRRAATALICRERTSNRFGIMVMIETQGHRGPQLNEEVDSSSSDQLALGPSCRSSLPPAPRVDRRSWWPSPVSFWSVRRIP